MRLLRAVQRELLSQHACLGDDERLGALGLDLGGAAPLRGA